MLVLSRLKGEEIVIAKDIVIRLVECRDGKARIGITAPREVPIYRRELLDRAPELAEVGGEAGSA